MADMPTTSTNVAVLTEDDVPGVSLSGRKPSELKTESLSFDCGAEVSQEKALRPKRSL